MRTNDAFRLVRVPAGQSTRRVSVPPAKRADRRCSVRADHSGGGLVFLRVFGLTARVAWGASAVNCLCAAALCVLASCVPARAADAKPRILLWGDSLCSNKCEFYLAMQRKFPQAEVIPGGIIGAATWQRAAWFPQPDRWIDRPDVVIVLMGVNNYAHDHAHRPEAGWADLESIRQRARKAHVPIFIGTPLPYGRWSSPGKVPCSPQWSARYVRELRGLIIRRSQPDVIDFEQAIPTATAERWIEDCLHPNAAGGKRMADLVRTTICKGHSRKKFMPLCAPNHTTPAHPHDRSTPRPDPSSG
jgi:lysophospholipase L1-like esterase